jgi:hypothetical protein
MMGVYGQASKFDHVDAVIRLDVYAAWLLICLTHTSSLGCRDVMLVSFFSSADNGTCNQLRETPFDVKHVGSCV